MSKLAELLRRYPVQQVAGFQLLWLSCVLGGNRWLWLPLLLIAGHLYLHRSQWRQELAIAPLAVVGLAVDVGLTAAGIYQFDHTPFWLLALWLGFVYTLDASMVWLRKLPLAALAGFGVVGGTSSYLAGERLGAVVIATPLLHSVAIIALCWAVLLPLLVRLDLALRRPHLTTISPQQVDRL